MRFTIEKISDDRLSKKTFFFYFYAGSDILYIFLDGYQETSRRSTRCKFRIDKKWFRLDQRHNSFTNNEVKSFITPEIEKELRDKIKEELNKVEISVIRDS